MRRGPLFLCRAQKNDSQVQGTKSKRWKILWKFHRFLLNCVDDFIKTSSLVSVTWIWDVHM